MRWLIDGYNVMHADGRLGPRLGREGFRRARRRFLDDLAASLGPTLSAQATVVFDATVPPGDFSVVSTYRGIEVVFALGDENADARIEQLIAGHPNPKSLVVFSSDRRIRQAATRRRARSSDADTFWELIDDLKARRVEMPEAERAGGAQAPNRAPAAEADDTAFWLEAFRDVGNDPAIQKFSTRHGALLTDAEIAEIRRLIERES
jgi:predicted RNA-binding protein with PIN domain